MYARTGRHSHPPDSPVVILVHGMVVSSRYMAPTARLLGSICRVFAIDLPGYGKSFKPPRTLQIHELADTLADWMDAMAIEKAHLAGNSFGCQILAEFALRHPRRVDRLVLQGPTVDAKARSFRRQLPRFVLDSYYDPSFMGLIMLKDYARAGLLRSLATIKMVMRDRIEEKLPHIPMPTLVVRGANDPIVPQRWAEEVVALLPRGELKVIPGAAHTLNFAAPLEFVRVTRPFLGI